MAVYEIVHKDENGENHFITYYGADSASDAVEECLRQADAAHRGFEISAYLSKI